MGKCLSSSLKSCDYASDRLQMEEMIFNLQLQREVIN